MYQLRLWVIFDTEQLQLLSQATNYRTTTEAGARNRMVDTMAAST